MIQKIFHVKFLNLSLLSFLDISSFVVGVLGMYGIYIGFLQYTTENNERGKYLGKNKTSYVLKDFFWYRFSQSKAFIFSLLVLTIVPNIIKLSLLTNEVNLNLIYLWQSSLLLLLIAFVFLLKMSLFLISIISTINSGVDYNLQSIIRERIQEEYTQKFWIEFQKELYIKKIDKIDREHTLIDCLIYKLSFFRKHQFMRKQLLYDNLEPRFLYNWLKYDTKNLSESEKKEFIELVFVGIQKDVYQKIGDNNKQITKNLEEFHRFYKLFVEMKWELFVSDDKMYRITRKKPSNIDIILPFESWYILLNHDIKIFNELFKIFDSELIYNYYVKQIKRQLLGSTFRRKKSLKFSDETVENFLWKMIFRHPQLDIQRVYDGLILSTKKIIDSNNLYKISVKKNGNSRVLKLLDFQYVRLKENRIKDNIKSSKRFRNFKFYQKEFEYFKWYQFWKQKNLFQNNVNYNTNIFRGSERTFNEYSKVLFESLEYSYEQFNQYQKNCILSMNNEYSLAFMLYHLLYTDYTEWDDNIEFYDAEIKKLMSCDEEQQNYLFYQAKEIILRTNISDRITDEILDKLWTKRNEKITNFSWFNQFGTWDQMSELKIMYIQWLLSDKKGVVSNRFDLENLSSSDEEKMNNICLEYFFLAEKLDSIFKKESYSSKKTDVQLSVEYLLKTNKVKLSNIIEKLSVSSLLRLEWILRFSNHRYNQDISYTSRTIFDSMISNSQFYWSGGKGVLEFYILKTIDDFYQDLYLDNQFIEGLKREMVSTLNSQNMMIDEYVEVISQKVSNLDSVSKFQKKEIIRKLNDLLYKTETKSNQSKIDYKKPYRYK
ncbi:hypothetical protein QM458_07020 [Streptococcus infantis]|uniref:hypothetical protein n=1 Tax=Streptococcus infantis TaxID=68892 RepID=UPI0039C2B84C